MFFSRRRFRKVLERRVKVGPSPRAAVSTVTTGRVKETDDENHSVFFLGRRRRRPIIITISIVTGTGREWSEARPAEGVLAAIPFERGRG